MSVNEFTTGELVEFKGSKKGIIVNIKRKATFDEIKNSIIDKLESAIGFFNGAKICSINCEYLSDVQIMMLKDDISSKFDVEFIEEYNKKEITNFQTKYVTNLRSGEDVYKRQGMCIIIENDFKDEVHESVIPNKDIENLTKEEIVNIVKEAGIVGMGGATFPTHVKISPPQGKNIDTVILNGAECEPYLTADHRLMLENPEDVVYGLYILMKALDVKKGYIGIEVNKLDAIEAIEKEVKKYENIEVSRLEIKYPQGAEKQLIYACTKREVPSGGLPMDVGVVVNNVETAAQIARTIKTCLLYTSRCV